MPIMPGPTPSARKAALITGGLITAGLIAFFVIEGPKQSEFRGMGMALILEKQDEWRRELILDGRHLNELATWQIQEEVAKRSHLSEGGVKGLSRRASNAKDRVLAVDGHLISGNQELAAEMAWSLAPQMEGMMDQFTPSQVAHMYRNAGDAAWQGGRADFSPAEAYQTAIAVLAKSKGTEEQRAWLQLDLASYHWSQVNFFPEDPDGELASMIEAARAAGDAFAQMKTATPLAQVAAKRLEGEAWLKRAAMAERAIAGTASEEMAGHLAKAVEMLSKALALAEPSDQAFLKATLHHKLGLALTLQAAAEREQKDDRLAEAELHFQSALERRPASFAAGSIDVRMLGRRLQERAESLAALSFAQFLAAQNRENAEGLRTSIQSARAALQLTTERDDSPAWVTAVGSLAFAQTCLCQEAATAVEAAPFAHEAIENALSALRKYPIGQQNEPGVPSRASFLRALGAVCDQVLKQPDIPGIHLYVDEMEAVVRPIFEAVGASTDPTTFSAASITLNRILELKARVRADGDVSPPKGDEEI